jgi:hypothetical protein
MDYGKRKGPESVPEHAAGGEYVETPPLQHSSQDKGNPPQCRPLVDSTPVWCNNSGTGHVFRTEISEYTADHNTGAFSICDCTTHVNDSTHRKEPLTANPALETPRSQRQPPSSPNGYDFQISARATPTDYKGFLC